MMNNNLPYLSSNITCALAAKLIASQFPEYAYLPITSVDKQGHDNRTFRLGDTMLIRMPTEESYALKVPKEQTLLPRLKPYLSVSIPEPIKMGQPSSDYPFSFSIYQWLEGQSANHLKISEHDLESLALQLAQFLKALQNIKNVEGPAPGQHNWWRGDHVSVYDDGARKQIHELSCAINKDKAIALWEQSCATQWNKAPVWIHGDFAPGNIIIKDEKLSGVIDFGGTGVGDPACDLVIAWTFLSGKSRQIFIEAMELDSDTYLRAKAWSLWKATYEFCQIPDKTSHEAAIQKKIIDEVLA
jgi:aminoglycoside phosphotransferase (APT) family kinase protein